MYPDHATNYPHQNPWHKLSKSRGLATLWGPEATANSSTCECYSALCSETRCHWEQWSKTASDTSAFTANGMEQTATPFHNEKGYIGQPNNDSHQSKDKVIINWQRSIQPRIQSYTGSNCFLCLAKNVIQLSTWVSVKISGLWPTKPRPFKEDKKALYCGLC